MRFDTILIANRGEIAVRIIKTARKLGYQTVAVYADADADALHVKEADRAVRLGPSTSAQSYLASDKVIAAAKASGSGAIHPGYGFLSENAEFAKACTDAGLVFIGPTAEAIRIMGDKQLAKREMLAAGVPCVPGYQGDDQGAATLYAEAAKIGYPVMVKAAAGGGGKGMRLVGCASDFDANLLQAKSEAMAAFGSDTMLLEKAITAPRHVEIQVFADSHGNTIYLGERDCSVQRRHQKVLEEAPSPAVSDDLRARMGKAAVEAARVIGYIGAGTVEFLLDQDDAFYFLEMNTRLQVEHTVTEMVTGLDLVEWQIAVAQGDVLPMSQTQISTSGWAIEARVYAEDPATGFLPSVGEILRLDVPCGQGVRVDNGVDEGGAVSPFYDPMLAKVIAHGATRDEARRRLVRALKDMCLFGVRTNRGFLINALDHPEFAIGAATTGFIETHFPAEILENPFEDTRWAATAAAVLYASMAADTRARLTRPAHYLFEVKEARLNIKVLRISSGLRVDVDGQSFDFDQFRFDGRKWQAECQGITLDGAALIAKQGEVWLDVEGHALIVRDLLAEGALNVAPGDLGQVRAPMHGRVVDLRACAGDIVVQGQPVLVLEAMKMQHTLQAGMDGTLDALHVSVGDQVEAGQVLAEVTEISDI